MNDVFFFFIFFFIFFSWVILGNMHRDGNKHRASQRRIVLLLMALVCCNIANILFALNEMCCMCWPFVCSYVCVKFSLVSCFRFIHFFFGLSIIHVTTDIREITNFHIKKWIQWYFLWENVVFRYISYAVCPCLSLSLSRSSSSFISCFLFQHSFFFHSKPHTIDS